jgi:hypothetical protein
MTTLAEKLRAWQNAKSAVTDMRDAVPDDWRSADFNTVALYLRGYDDAKAETANVEMHLREADHELANANARVRELEANNRDLLSTKVIVCDDHEVHEQSAAVGVVGAVLGYTNLYEGNRFGGWYTTAQDAKKGSLTGAPRVVAIVDPDAIVPLASGTPVRWLGEFPGFKYIRNTQEEIASIGVDTVTPLYPGLAQNVQEGE